ncbi:Yip1 protein [Spironucleus salmonicida]|uniref:Protein YIPF n=1 Tax=Spironucleus salmonicida TaxID=348837 RepID=V6M7Z0_9EUKA|nr:Yip1 protein [Spironucleus salmonicida]|eukprot:EST49594.1 Yip1 and transmembrane domain-containing protein [Spironucleus salmonicida]
MADFEQPSYQPQPEVQPDTEKQAPPPPPDYLLNTINETVAQTLWRDLKLILIRTWQVVWVFNRSSNLEVYEQYDLFGPFFYGLIFSISLELAATISNMTVVCMSVIFIGSLIVALNIAVLGGKVSILGTICLIGYCIAPLSFAALIVFILTLFQGLKAQWYMGLIVACLAAFTAVWGLFAAWGFFRNVIIPGKQFQSVYPVLFLFAVLAMFLVFGMIA